MIDLPTWWQEWLKMSEVSLNYIIENANAALDNGLFGPDPWMIIMEYWWFYLPAGVLIGYVELKKLLEKREAREAES